ncbi:MAG: carboxymuconolactone decarboxylase family protein [Actinobacteria bacterium]|nr:carboxymuconolactone decarboxylase family protein [Actinomycetota bacterium]
MSPDELRALAPEPFAALDVLRVTPAGIGRGDLDALVAALVGGLLEPDARCDRERASSVFGDALPFLEQMVLDVSSITDAERVAAVDALGADAFSVVQWCWSVDVCTRLFYAWRQLFEAVPRPETLDPAPSLWEALESFFAAVARCDELDPVTTELVRLRGARAHDCRLCRSIRSLRAAEGGVTEATYDAVDHYERSALAERHKVALRLVDAIVWQPVAYPSGLAEQVRSQFTPGEAVELVLDVARNGANKIAVALGADAPHVEDGIEYYAIAADGTVVYGGQPSY